MNLDRFPRHPAALRPVSGAPLSIASLEHLGGAQIWAKREDVNSGLAYGGNKTRKLEYLVADALAQGCDTLVSIGGVQSNHTRQVAAAAARDRAWPASSCRRAGSTGPTSIYDRVGNIQLSRIMGADVRLDPAGFGIGFKESWERALDDVRARAAARPTRSRPRVRLRARRPGLRRLGARGRRSRSARSASSSTRSSSARSPLELSGPMFMSYPAINHVEIKLEPIADGTRVTLRHRALGMLDPAHKEGVKTGWGMMLEAVKNDFSKATGTPA